MINEFENGMISHFEAFNEKTNPPLRNEAFMSKENKNKKSKKLCEGMNLSGFIAKGFVFDSQ